MKKSFLVLAFVLVGFGYGWEVHAQSFGDYFDFNISPTRVSVGDLFNVKVCLKQTKDNGPEKLSELTGIRVRMMDVSHPKGWGDFDVTRGNRKIDNGCVNFGIKRNSKGSWRYKIEACNKNGECFPIDGGKTIDVDVGLF